MKENVNYYNKCMLCNHVEEYVLRHKSKNCTVNEKLTDSDIHIIISSRTENPYTNSYCNKCDKHTLQMCVGFDYVDSQE